MSKPRILMTSPMMSYKDRWGQYYKGAGDTFPIGLGSIASHIETNGYSTDVIEPDIMGMSAEDFIRYIENGRYDIIGISAFTPNVHLAYNTAELIRSRHPEVKIVLGGSHPTIFPERSMEECPAVDFVITHEGEIPMLQLVRVIEQGGSLSKVPNLWYKDSGIKSSGTVAEWLDLDSLPLFPYDKFDIKLYTPAPSLRRTVPTFNYMAQRGCPFQCSFCDTRTHGRKVRYRNVGKVIDDLVVLRDKYKLKGLIFEGSNFTASTDWVRELCNEMRARKLHYWFYSMGRVDLDVNLLSLMKKAGLWAMSFGIESANPKTLEKMNKRIKPEQVRDTLKVLRKLRVQTIGSVILGYPGESEEDVLNTINYVCDIDLDIAVFFVPVPFPGTLLYDHAVQDSGLRKGIQWRDYSAWLDHNNPIYVNPLLGERQSALYNYAFRRFYVRPRYLLKQFTRIHSFADVGRLFQGLEAIWGLIAKGFSGR